MRESKIKELESLNLDDFVWYIYIFISVAAIYSNKLEKDFIVTGDRQKFREFHNINTVVLTIAFFVYVYFVFNNFRTWNKKRNYNTTINVIASILFLVGGGILILVELNSSNDNTNIVGI